MLDISSIRESGSSLYHDLSTNVTSVSAFDLLYEQYAMACPEHSYKTRIFSMDPLIIYLENYISAPEREYIVNLAESQYTKSEVAEAMGDDRVSALVPDYRSSQTAYFFEDPVTQCIEDRAAFFQGNLPVERVEALQVVKYTVGDQFRQHWDWWEGADNPRISTFFAYLACDSGESGNEDRCEGGATHFSDLGKDFPRGWCDVIDCSDDSELDGVAFKPIVGNAIFWSNVHPNGTYHQGTYHAGMPVKKGQKVGLNIWTHRDEFLYSGLADEDEMPTLS
ncbi:Prolyl 4-hydroxylase, alpha polypeptide [Xylographa soralifera]|nr:Prolyl 4-hydroxylase, alpha polypeptide [Xylographa soralifera]